MTDAPSPLTAPEFQLSGGVDDWRVLGNGTVAWFEAPSHRVGAELVRAISELAQGQGASPPHLDLRAQGLRVRIPSNDGLTTADVALARAISEAARERGLRADPTHLQELQLAIDALDPAQVSPFWQVALGYDSRGTGLVDPLHRQPPIWFHQQDAPSPLRNRIHVDAVSAQPTAVEAVAAAQTQGASSVADHDYYATVADAEGNEVDLLPLPEEADRWGGAETEDWRVVFAGVTCYPTAAAQQSVELAEVVAELADDAGLPLGIDLRPGLATIATGKDAWEGAGYHQLAAQVQEAARAMGLVADVRLPRFVQVVIDAVDIPAVREFWRAVLGYEEDPRAGVTDIVDPRQLTMPFVFQDLDGSDEARRAQRNRIHIDLFVPDDQAQARIDAGLAAGGRIVYADGSTKWSTLADAEGNEVDIWLAARPT